MSILSSAVNLICVCLIKPDMFTRSGVISDGSCVNDINFLLKRFFNCVVNGIVFPPVVVLFSAAVAVVALKLVVGR